MNLPQRVILLIGLALFIGAGLYPKWIRVALSSSHHGRPETSVPAKHYFIAHPPETKIDQFSLVKYKIDYPTLFTYWGIITAFTIFGVLFAGFWNEPPKDEPDAEDD